jgi:NifU-like protein involved in Fe-S cluster formation
MKNITVVFAVVAISGCGVETAATSATATVAKKQEIEQGKKTMDEVRQKIGQAMEQVQQSRQEASDADGK